MTLCVDVIRKRMEIPARPNATALQIIRKGNVPKQSKTTTINQYFMKLILSAIVLAGLFCACNNTNNQNSSSKNSPSIEGTWQLMSGTIIENGDTTVTDYTNKQSMIKIINATHFSFLNHDKNKG